MIPAKILMPVSLRTRRRATPVKWAYIDAEVHHRLQMTVKRCGGVNHVAKMAGIPTDRLIRYMYFQLPSLEGIYNIASACGVSVDYLIGRKTFSENLRHLIVNPTHRKHEGMLVAFALVGAIAFIWLPVIMGGW